MHSFIRIRCPGCDARIRAPLALLGRTRGCPRCACRLVVRTKAPADSLPVLAGDEPPAFRSRRE